MSKYIDVLVAGVGLSPAVLTNTVWALAHKNEPVVPDEIVVVTTATARKCIDSLLLSGGGWERLYRQLSDDGLDIEGKLAFGASDSIRILGDGKSDFDDIATPEQNDAAADFILKVLRQYTEDPGTRVIASIAGGRKSMSALMMSCMSLLGREQDRLCHVLVNEPYERLMDPPFLFPEKGMNHRLGDKTYPSTKAHPQLSDIPFVRVRGWYEKEFNRVPPSYMQLVSKVQGVAPRPANYPVIKLDVSKGSLLIDKTPVLLSGCEFALVYLMLLRIKEERMPSCWHDMETDFAELLRRKFLIPASWFHTLKEKRAPDAEDYRKWASSARSKLRSAFSDAMLVNMILPSMRGVGCDVYPKNRVSIDDVS
jgi:CRISPR-associated protein (TIGR02584 family)